ncbi:MAG: GNAT family N-acetyltransferase [Clostridia bacterium]|nr:GNAT family N-acetyltransferase [Clostridia bacterium]
MEIKTFIGLPQEAKNIRETVFVKEQGFTDEYDEKDAVATHFVMFEDGKAIATCRIFEKEEKGVYMFGRMAVLKQLRGKNLGRKMIEAAQNFVSEQGGKKIILHAQLHAQGFYEKNGFSPYGEIESEQGCPHIWMEKELI